MFEKESVGSNSVSTSPPTSGLCSSSTGSDNGGEKKLSPPPWNRRRFSSEENMDKCFYCQKPGHWVRDCPNKSPKGPQPPSSVAHDLPIIHCPCGAGPCVVLVSGTPANPGRKFYRCPQAAHYFVSKCTFFKWCDTVTSDEIIYAPTCSCGAGTCRISKETTGPNAGRSFFACPIKKGQGACNFIQFLDATNELLDESISSPQSTVTNCHDTSPSNSDLIEERDFSHQGMEIESPVVDAAEHPRKFGVISEPSIKERVPLVDLQGQEDSSDEPLLRKHYKRLRHGAPKIDSFILGSNSDCSDMTKSKLGDPTMDKALRASVLTSEALIHQRQAKFLRQISSAGGVILESFSCLRGCYMICMCAASSTSSYYSSSALPTTGKPLTQNYLETAAIYKILGFHFKGWCGRLVFPPSRCLTFPAPKPFFCCVFPSFDRIFVSQDPKIHEAEPSLSIEIQSLSSVESDKPPLLTPGQPLGALFWEPSGLRPPSKILQGNIMKQSILEVFKEAAVRLQDGLLNLLESMDFHDHESMLRESYSVFGALEGLSVDYQSFKEQVTEFIGHAASLDEVELSIHDDRSSQKLVDWYNCKRMQLEDISRRHAETSIDLKASNERLQSLQKEASRVQQMLFYIETELSYCEAKNMEIGTRFDQITEDMLQSELNVQVAYKEAEEALELCRQREAERNVAKASFEEARSKIRQSCNVSFLI